jgi:CheY-like chemotaxis protein
MCPRNAREPLLRWFLNKKHKKNMRILIVDDNWEHGTSIKQALHTAGFKADFFEFDEKNIEKLKHGVAVRIIFCDLNLGGDGVGGTKDYAIVSAVLEQIIQANNGPYVLISWTTFAKEAEGLLEYVKKRLPAHCHPIDFKIIDKENLIAPAQGLALKKVVLDTFAEFPAIRAALEWECAVSLATTSVLEQLEAVASIDGVEKFDKRLHQIFTKLAEAEGGPKAIDRDDITHPLTMVLGRLLHDELTRFSIEPLIAQKDENFAGFDPKKPALNAMLHVHTTLPALGNVGSLPGLVFPWPADETVPGIPPIGERDAFTKSHFLKNSAKPDEIARCRLVLMDVTPTCDHSINDIVWRRMVGGVLIPQDSRNLCDANSNGAGRLMSLPVVSLKGENVFLVLNAQFHVSVPNGIANLRGLQPPEFLLKEQIYSDVLGWIGRQVSRQGHTFFSFR